MNCGLASRGKRITYELRRLAGNAMAKPQPLRPLLMEAEMLMSQKENQPVIVPSSLQTGLQTGKRNAKPTEPSCCEICSGNVGLLTAERAAMLCQCSRRKIYHWIEEGHLHFVELPDGTVLVCGRTLAKKIEELSSSTDKLNSH